MAQMPIEIIEIGNIPDEWISPALSLANSLQNEFIYVRLPETEAQQLKMYAFNLVEVPEFIDRMEQIRSDLRGYHPYILAFIDAQLNGKDYTNLFASDRAEVGLGVLTTANVPGIIIPPEQMPAYFLYYLARFTLRYIVPGHTNHADTRSCVYDRKINKLDILMSMRARSMCDECRRSLLSGQTALSPQQFFALEKMFDMCGKILDGSLEAQENKISLPRAFIGSSTEGLEIANSIQAQLQYELDCEVWNQGTVFGLGNSTLEALEQAVLTYDFGIFIFTPDDQIRIREEYRLVARDNVVFELGLFIGKLTRKRVFVVNPNNISLPSDLAGITTATYDPNRPNLIAALGPACQKIREAVKNILRN